MKKILSLALLVYVCSFSAEAGIALKCAGRVNPESKRNDFSIVDAFPACPNPNQPQPGVPSSKLGLQTSSQTQIVDSLDFEIDDQAVATVFAQRDCVYGNSGMYIILKSKLDSSILAMSTFSLTSKGGFGYIYSGGKEFGILCSDKSPVLH